MSNIGIMGGSFDPVHLGHIELAKLAMQQLSLDRFMFIPVANNPWKEHSGATKQQRVEMLQIAIASMDNVMINTLEIDSDNGEKNFTIDTLKQIKKQYPTDNIFYIMGMDQASQFEKWKSADEISELVQLVAFKRDGYQLNATMKTFRFMTLENTPNAISSTAIRHGNISYLDRNVLRYITNNGIYLETMLKHTMSKKRFVHTKSMASLAKEIAKANSINENKAYVAGMFHDIAKEMPIDEARVLMEKLYPEHLHKPFPLWHQWLSAHVAKEEYVIEDIEILQAIERHTTASVHMSKLDMCIYVADNYDPSRGYDVEQKIALCKRDLVAGFKQSLKDTYDILKKKKKEIDSSFYEIYETFVKEKLDE